MNSEVAYRVFSRDVMAVMLVYLNNRTAAHVGVPNSSYGN